MFGLWKTFASALYQTAASTISIPNYSSLITKRFTKTLYGLHMKNMRLKENPISTSKKGPLDGKPFAKGVILRTIIKNPRKPNSANRKCVVVRLSSGKEMIAYVPGIGHNLQEHQTVLCRVGKLQDVPGVKIKCVRGKYDLPHVKPKN